jgi:hypothetical protein
MKTTPDLSAMWAALEKYQPYADADGHGETWRRMCSERTEEAAAAAVEAESAAYWSELAIKRIERAIKDREPELSSPAPVSNDDGQAQKMDAPEPLIHKHEWFRTGAMAHGVCRCIHCGAWNHEVESLKRQPLTDEEISILWSWAATPEYERTATTQQHAFARAIEAAHGIGGDK